MARRLATMLVLAGALAAPSARAAYVVVLSDAAIRPALAMMGERWKEKTGHEVVTFTAPTSRLLVEQVARVFRQDILVTAGEALMDEAERRGLVKPATRSRLARDRLVLVSQGRDAPPQPVELAPTTDAATLPDEGRLAIPDLPGSPAAAIGERQLRALGLWSRLEDRVVGAGGVDGVLALLADGRAALGLLRASDAARAAGIDIVASLPASADGAIVYVAAVTRRSASPAANGFLEFVKTPEGQDLLERAGLSVEQ